MRKEGLIKEISLRTGLLQKEVRVSIATMVDIIKESMQEDETIYMRGFVTMTPRIRKERMARDMQRNIPMVTSQKKVVKFKLSAKFIKEINK